MTTSRNLLLCKEMENGVFPKPESSVLAVEVPASDTQLSGWLNGSFAIKCQITLEVSPSFSENRLKAIREVL